ncbi:hypothetical protein GLOTRDRAFT_123091 [Gloeophyllum trabeum ATCC 11539]|uniref:Uncharacterized protein n=1 Tax=Gloeophyllum trabeum (strain ATCC 11539 / FP-39264 / Madison 617) TaxID=670483 RepID=S7PV89_GLOTA|nr:uncharacterized protein GLOTRDRAFT_123091 [Gloeophyllum trabeum ATCC 11539]EPQ51448.1 hypothetical protein GLOTRDRAFT_123091 [Gloeophyllum trabeum ATCC 11539]
MNVPQAPEGNLLADALLRAEQCVRQLPDPSRASKRTTFMLWHTPCITDPCQARYTHTYTHAPACVAVEIVPANVDRDGSPNPGAASGESSDAVLRDLAMLVEGTSKQEAPHRRSGQPKPLVATTTLEATEISQRWCGNSRQRKRGQLDVKFSVGLGRTSSNITDGLKKPFYAVNR